MFKVNKYREMEEFIAQFNKITGNGEWAISMKYLTYFRWNVNVSEFTEFLCSFMLLCQIFDDQKLV